MSKCHIVGNHMSRLIPVQLFQRHCWKSHVTANTCTTVSVIDPLKLYISGITSKESEEKLQKMFPKASNIECIKDKKGIYKM